MVREQFWTSFVTLGVVLASATLHGTQVVFTNPCENVYSVAVAMDGIDPETKPPIDSRQFSKGWIEVPPKQSIEICAECMFDTIKTHGFYYYSAPTKEIRKPTSNPHRSFCVPVETNESFYIYQMSGFAKTTIALSYWKKDAITEGYLKKAHGFGNNSWAQACLKAQGLWFPFEKISLSESGLVEVSLKCRQ